MNAQLEEDLREHARSGSVAVLYDKRRKGPQRIAN